MKAKKPIYLFIIVLLVLLKFAWFLTIEYHGDNTTEQKEAQIAAPIFLGCNIAIFFCFVLLLISWLWPRIKKNLSNSG